MADQTTLTRANGSPGSVRPEVGDPEFDDKPRAPGRTEVAAGEMVSNVAGFGENLLNLAELQARMTVVEARQNIEVVKTAGAVLVAGTIIALAAFPILLVAFAEFLVSELGWRRGYAFLTVASITIGIGAFCAASSAVWLRRQRFGFPLSMEEFTRNLNWVHTVLRLSGRRPSGRR
jgi:Putative Actinobacterial Holin-X, holin superfamily III